MGKMKEKYINSQPVFDCDGCFEKFLKTELYESDPFHDGDVRLYCKDCFDALEPKEGEVQEW